MDEYPKSQLDAIAFASHAWRLRLKDGDMDEAEKSAFEAWLKSDIRHEEAFDRAVTIASALETLSPETFAPPETSVSPATTTPSAAHLAFTKRFFSLVEGMLPPVSSRPVQAAAAACLVVLFMVFGAFSFIGESDGTRVKASFEGTFQTSRAEVRTIALVDGTDATLGPASHLLVTYTDERRELQLVSGTALFDVAHDADRPFAVEAGRLTATALGTVFDVRHSAQVVRVAVAEGAVNVQFPLAFGSGRTEMMTRDTLAAGQQIVARDGRLSDIWTIDTESVGAWRSARLEYIEASLAELVADAQRYSDVAIKVVDPEGRLADVSVSASFDGANIEAMLSMLPDVAPVVVDQSDPGRVILRYSE